jgi:spore coat polysaccharide biosynthesis protein SpsF
VKPMRVKPLPHKEGLRIVATVEARMSSSRLPGKVLLPANGKPMLAHLVDRLRSIDALDGIVLATTVNPADDVLETFALDEGIDCFRGNEQDVMGRVIGAGDHADADVLVEFTGDCPIVDPEIVEQSIQFFLCNHCEYVSTGHVSSYPQGTCDNQIFFLNTLKRSAEMTSDPEDREHVTHHIKRHPEIFVQAYLIGPPDLYWPDMHLLLDTKDDYVLLKRIIEHFGDTNPHFGCAETLNLLSSRPDWPALNQDVKRTRLGQRTGS